jgi:hypothetical protein
MSPPRRDTRLLIIAGACALGAGLALAALILFATSQGGSPSRYRPFNAGLASDIETKVKQGGPYFTPDPFGGSRTVMWAVEHGKVVALSITLPGTKDCAVRWKGRIDSFVDCHGNRVRSEQLDRFPSTVSTASDTKGALLVDLRRLEPPPAGGTPAVSFSPAS